jgi:hypothetical protein
MADTSSTLGAGTTGPDVLQDPPLDPNPQTALKNLQDRQQKRADVLKKLQAKTSASQTDLADISKAGVDLQNLTHRFGKARSGYQTNLQMLSQAAQVAMDGSKLQQADKDAITKAVTDLFSARDSNQKDLDAKQTTWESDEIQNQKDNFESQRDDDAFQKFKDNYGQLDAILSQLSTARDDITKQQSAGQDKLAYLGACLLQKQIVDAKTLVDPTVDQISNQFNQLWKTAQQARRNKTASRATADQHKSDRDAARKKLADDWSNGKTDLANRFSNPPKTPTG